jgi:hypothetical protein
MSMSFYDTLLTLWIRRRCVFRLVGLAARTWLGNRIIIIILPATCKSAGVFCDLLCVSTLGHYILLLFVWRKFLLFKLGEGIVNIASICIEQLACLIRRGSHGHQHGDLAITISDTVVAHCFFAFSPLFALFINAMDLLLDRACRVFRKEFA